MSKYENDWDAMAERFNVPLKKLLDMQMSFEEEILVKDVTEKNYRGFST